MLKAARPTLLGWMHTRTAPSKGSGIGCCAAQHPWRAALSFRRQVAVEHHDAGLTGRCCYGSEWLSAKRWGRDAAPTEAGAVPDTSSASDHACLFNVLVQDQPGTQLPVRDG